MSSHLETLDLSGATTTTSLEHFCLKEIHKLLCGAISREEDLP
jgi:hypothetical protein